LASNFRFFWGLHSSTGVIVFAVAGKVERCGVVGAGVGVGVGVGVAARAGDAGGAGACIGVGVSIGVGVGVGSGDVALGAVAAAGVCTGDVIGAGVDVTNFSVFLCVTVAVIGTIDCIGLNGMAGLVEGTGFDIMCRQQPCDGARDFSVQIRVNG
jgi:hypothetical protein